MIALLLALHAAPSLTLGLDLALYRPGIDAEAGISSPYADVFGTGRGPLIGGHAGMLIPLPGDIGLTLGAGLTHFEKSAKSFVDDGDGEAPSSGSDRSGGQTSIYVNPITFMLGARLRVLWERLGVPIVPYAEGGLAYAPWSVDKGDGTTVAAGASMGLAAGAGIYVELIAAEQRSAKTLREEFGVSSVALRAGMVTLWIDGFGANDALVLSDTAWSFGVEVGF